MGHLPCCLAAARLIYKARISQMECTRESPIHAFDGHCI
jgi:hypothetical protein